METIFGKAVYSGIAIGSVFKYSRYAPNISQDTGLPICEEKELARWEQVCAQADAELSAMVSAAKGNQEKADIINAQLSILKDPELLDSIRINITDSHYPLQRAIREAFDAFISILKEVDNAYIQGRVNDMEDVCLRLLRCAEGKPDQTLAALSSPSILVATELFPSDFAMMNAENVLGIVSETGSETSHVAILAKGYGIPSILGAAGAAKVCQAGDQAILDTYGNKVIFQPDAITLSSYAEQQKLRQKEQAEAVQYLQKPAQTKDGKGMEVDVNLGAVDGKVAEYAQYADGVGLFRTEFLYMESSQQPDEESQFRAYRQVLEAFGPKPLILRTLDIGGDKVLPYMETPKEDNPFLGIRGVRFCLENPQVFRTQLRAAIRASVFGNLWIMFPMIGGLADFREAKAFFQKVAAELEQEGIPFRHNIRLGVMIEIPSAAVCADLLAKEVDFASIGTNDLIQYVNAADRINSNVSRYYQMFHPAMLRLLKTTIDAFQAAGKPIGLCGEMGSHRSGSLVLAGLGLKKISMPGANIGSFKRNLAQVEWKDLQDLGAELLEKDTAEAIQAAVDSFMKRNAL